MKLREISNCGALALVALCLGVVGCGSSSGPIATTVTLGSSIGGTLILGQSTTITATVVGPSNLNVTWGGGSSNTAACTYTTTTFNSSGTPTTTTAVKCPSDGTLGTLSNLQDTTATYLAPSALPSPTTYPGLLIYITACTVATPVKCGNIQLAIDSGVSVSLTPGTAAVPTNEQQPFIAVLTNDLQSEGVTWLVTQSVPTSTTVSTNTNIYASLPTCTVTGNATGCGSIDQNGVYTAPAVIPTNTTPQNTQNAPTDCTTPQSLTIVATSKEDPTRFATGTITITQAGPITFSGITPTIAPQGAEYWDIYLNAPNMSSASIVTLTDVNKGTTTLTSGSGQMKVLFPITGATSTGTTVTPPGCSTSITTTTTPASTGARVRLFSSNLATTGPVTVSVSDPAEPVTQSTTGTFTYNIMPVRPTVSASTPNDIVQNFSTSANSTNLSFSIDGGYFGNNGQLANVFFGNQVLAGSTNGAGQPLSSPKQLDVQFPSGQINTGLPGLYSLSVSRTTTPAPFTNNPAISDLAVFPSYLTDPPFVVGPPISTGAGTNPSAIDIDPTLGIIAVAETSANAVQFYTIGNGALTPLGNPVGVGKLPTGLSINKTNHTVAVVNYGDQSVTVIPIPGASALTPFTIDLSGVLQGAVSPAPLPYSIGVDPDTNMGIVAYSSTSASSAANLGFLVNLNSAANPSYGCITSSATPPCVYAQVTLDTGAYPQVAMAPHGHLAFVTPGGSGTLRGVDVTKPSASVGIKSLTLAAGLVTVTLAPNTSNSFLFPGNAGSVLITGVPTLMNCTVNNNLNGVYTAAVVSDTSFTYISNSLCSDTVNITQNADGSWPANVYFSSPNLIFGGVSQTAQGIAINPITNTGALADADSTGGTGAQVYVVNNLDQSVTTIPFKSGCTVYTTTCSEGSELLGTADIAWQPYSNAIVSYNPGMINQVSVSNPVTSQRYAFACEIKTGTAKGCIIDPATEIKNGGPNCVPPATLATCTQMFVTQSTLQGTGEATINSNIGTTPPLTLWGGLAVDPATNQAFVVMSGSNQIDIINLGPCTANSNSDTNPGPTGCPNPFNNLKPAEISDILVPSPVPGLGQIGGIPNATMPQGTLTSSTNLQNVLVFGAGFDSNTVVRLDGVALPAGNMTPISSRELMVTIPASYLSFPHRYALDLVNGTGVQSNATDFIVVQAVDLSKICTDASGNPINTMPSSVAIADQLVNGPFSPIAVVSNGGCNNISVVDINPTVTVGGQTIQNPNFGQLQTPIAVGMTPQGVAVSEPFGLAVVANNGDGTASVVNLLTNSLAVPDVGTGTNPTGVAINDATGAAIVTNTGSNTVSQLNLALLFGSSPATTLSPISIGGFQEPTAVAIDPDRGTNGQGLAVVTSLQLEQGLPTQGVLAPVDIGAATPVLSSTIAAGSVTAPATGIVFDPTVLTGTANNGVFYASSSGGNVISSFNPDSGSIGTVNVGINPTALALNPQTGVIMTTNVAGKTTSIVDTTSSPLKTVQTMGLPGSPQFGIAIDQFTNLAVIVDQGNNRLLIIEVPR